MHKSIHSWSEPGHSTGVQIMASVKITPFLIMSLWWCSSLVIFSQHEKNEYWALSRTPEQWWKLTIKCHLLTIILSKMNYNLKGIQLSSWRIWGILKDPTVVAWWCWDINSLMSDQILLINVLLTTEPPLHVCVWIWCIPF